MYVGMVASSRAPGLGVEDGEKVVATGALVKRARWGRATSAGTGGDRLTMASRECSAIGPVTIAAVSSFLIAVTGTVLGASALLRRMGENVG
jgi:hypothetical protein